MIEFKNKTTPRKMNRWSKKINIMDQLTQKHHDIDGHMTFGAFHMQLQSPR